MRVLAARRDGSRTGAQAAMAQPGQPKLAVDGPDDRFEREADLIAEQVTATQIPDAAGAPLIRSLAASPAGSVDEAPASVSQALAGSGSPLEPALREQMQQRLGHDFSEVRVHADATAERSARELNAHAYTLGHDIVFGAGRFSPGTAQGRRLIAHELVHVAQQAGADEQGALRHTASPAMRYVQRDSPPGAGPVRAPSPEPQFIEFEIGPEDPAHPGRVLLTSSPVSERQDYIDLRMRYVEYGIYLGGFNVYIDEFSTPPIFISNAYLEDRTTSVSVGDRIFDSIAEAKASAAAYTRQGDKTPRHAYYWGAGGRVIAPTVFSTATTPRIMATLFAARAELARQVQQDLISILGTIVINKALGIAYGRARKAFTGEPPAKQVPVEEQRSGGPAPEAKAPEEPAPQGQKTTPKAPAPPPRPLIRATTTDIAKLKNEGFVFEGTSADGRTAVYRNPTTGQRANVTLRQGGPGWVNPAWGRNRLEAELRKRGFTLARPTRGEGGFIYRNASTGEEIRIMPRPSEEFRGEPIEKHLNNSYYRYRPRNDVEWGEHTTIPDKE